LKEDVREMAAGFECGVMVDGFTDFQVGDIVEMFTIEEIARRI
jgi:translation initiation factor IF-2